MTYFTGLLIGPERSASRWNVRISSDYLNLLRSPIALVRGIIARERTRRQLLELDTRLLRDIGLEPYEIFHGWAESKHSKR